MNKKLNKQINALNLSHLPDWNNFFKIVFILFLNSDLQTI